MLHVCGFYIQICVESTFKSLHFEILKCLTPCVGTIAYTAHEIYS